MVKIHKISGYVVDIDETFNVEDLKYALDVMEFFAPQLHIETANIGEWNDDNPLNHLNCDLAECEKYFPKAEPMKYGKWIEVGSLSCRCDQCGCKNNREANYCPNCGAKMERE